MAYNRNTAKTRAVLRVQETREMTQGFLKPVLQSWNPEPPPYTPRCRRCGCRATLRAGRCAICGAAQ